VRWLVLFAVSCGESPPALPDAAVAPDADPCTANNVVRFSGSLVDWDAPASGISGATIVADGAPSATTATDGTFELCLTEASMTLVEVAPTGHVGGTAVVLKELATSGDFTLRAFTAARAAAFGFDPARAHVFVHVVGEPRAIAVSAPHDPALHWKAPDWIAGATGTDVYLPNVDLNGGTTKLVVEDTTMLSEIPLAAGELTFVVLGAI